MLARWLIDKQKWEALNSVDHLFIFEARSKMSIIKGSQWDGMIETHEWLKLCNVIKLYKEYSEKGAKDCELLSISPFDDDVEFKGLLLLIQLYLEGDERVVGVMERIRDSLDAIERQFGNLPPPVTERKGGE